MFIINTGASDSASSTLQENPTNVLVSTWLFDLSKSPRLVVKLSYSTVLFVLPEKPGADFLQAVYALAHKGGTTAHEAVGKLHGYRTAGRDVRTYLILDPG
jgi:hypothetical protein